ncbi:precorrin-3B synthase [Novosphingobium sp. CF614]|uniref:cobalamin biosynthesis protein CobG n=1 Tax=Novosphingobium sp. CF614 TaxID=1884364 RepID=UPI0008E8A8B5|nr:cobalamin biosynthesis protein CobG [Novosphingobium sp. CF614]SFG01450.1 precorrin-3B synthase [Novosphingobium sp. CF614]
MSGFAAKGWCPDAWHPMMAGDGLLVRVKPRLGRLTREQVLGLCDAAVTHGNGLIDMTRRANLQIRGVRENGWQAMLDRLLALNLVNADPVVETRRNILVAPDWRYGDDSHRIASELQQRLDELPDLPGKVGFVIDAGQASTLRGEAGDFRIERGEGGSLILRADGRPAGVAVAAGQEADALIALANWFAMSGGADVGRMVRHGIALPDWAHGDHLLAPSTARIAPGRHDLGMVYGLPFGRIEASMLAGMMESLSTWAVRITPWRLLLLEGAPAERIEGLLSDIEDPLLRAEACPGAPCCPQATVETRELARRLAAHVGGWLHVSGCAKGCAHPRAADVTLTGRNGRFDLSLNAPAGGPSIRSALGPAEILAHFGAA